MYTVINFIPFIGDYFLVADDGDQYTNDDYTKVTVKRKLNDDEVYCLSTFEESFEDEVVKVEYVGSGNVDGKVSSIGAWSSMSF